MLTTVEKEKILQPITLYQTTIFLALSKLNALGDEKLNVTQRIKLVFHWGKEENAG